MVETSGNGAPPPRANPDLVGHESAEVALRRLFQSGRMPHAVLMTGPRGIGKATLAYRFARFVLAHGANGGEVGRLAEDERTLAVPATSGVFRRVASGGHADLLSIERAYDPRRRRLRSEIVVDETREIAAFLRLTAGEGGWRVVIVDGADAMNRSAANALLKILEEPPRQALLLLVAHNPGRLLPTIRSRCRRFPMTPLPPSIVSRLLETYRPDLPQAQSAALVALADGSIGRAIELAEAGGVGSVSSDLGAVVARAGGRSRRAACIGRPAGSRRSRQRLSRRRRTPVAFAGRDRGPCRRRRFGPCEHPSGERTLCCAVSEPGRRPPAGSSCASRSRRVLSAATHSILTGNRRYSAPSLL